MKATKEKEVKKVTLKVTKAKASVKLEKKLNADLDLPDDMEHSDGAIRDKASGAPYAYDSALFEKWDTQSDTKNDILPCYSDPNGAAQPLKVIVQDSDFRKIGRPKGEPKPPKEPGRRGRPPKLDSEPKVTKPLQMLLYPHEYEQYKQSGLTARQLFMMGLDAHNKIINDAHNLGMESKPVL